MAIPYAILPSTTHQCVVDFDEDGNTTTIHRSILNVAEKKQYECKNMFKNLAAGSWCVGSSNGWLVLLDKDAQPLLLNPFCATIIHLPPFPYSFIHPVSESYFVESLRKTFVVKAALKCSSSSSSSFSSDYILVIIYGVEGKLAFCKSQEWVGISDAKLSYCDIVFFNNCLYALTKDGSIEAWKFCEGVPKKILTLKPTMDINEEEEKRFPRDMFSSQLYLVISEGEILLVERYIGNYVNDDGVVVDERYLWSQEDSQPLICPYRTKHFNVYKLDFRNIKWEKVRSLHDQVLFLGANESTSIPVKGLKECEGNSIYFTDDRWEEMTMDYTYGGHDWGIFSLQDMSIKLLSPYAYTNEYEYKVDPPPIWAMAPKDN